MTSVPGTELKSSTWVPHSQGAQKPFSPIHQNQWLSNFSTNHQMSRNIDRRRMLRKKKKKKKKGKKGRNRSSSAVTGNPSIFLGTLSTATTAESSTDSELYQKEKPVIEVEETIYRNSPLEMDTLSTDSKSKELPAPKRYIWDCNLHSFNQSWLAPAVPSHAIQPAEFFSVHRMDITADSGKTRGSGVCVMVNNSWCNDANVVTLTRSCTPNLELLALKFCPFYLSRELTSVIVNTVYIPPQANMDTALWEVHEAFTQSQAQHWDAAFIVVGDFNSANLKRSVPNLYQHITFPTRGNRTLDHCYTPCKDTYKALAHPPFGKSDHATIFLIPKYKQRLKWETPVQREVARWTDQLVAALQDALDDMDWDMIWCSIDNVSEFTEAVVGLIGKLVDDMIPRATIKIFPNQKPWVDKTIREALKSSTAAYNVGIISGNMDKYKSAAYGVLRAVREAKRCYGKKLESQFQRSGSGSLWRGLWMIMDYRSPPSGLMSMDESLANELNTFFTRFEATSSSANANSTSTNNANDAISAANDTCAEPTIDQHPLIITESDMRRVFKRVPGRRGDQMAPAIESSKPAQTS
ncbi:hypothetical protein P4O66_002678 [Electrophorus voltai]|uniref:Endonuclease/exonuclease/phosphatase domain-containing protein n=1 Tax=Electrophorus voltai TaxID=2609070 RepID=A0AAD9DQ38_9TELE|nr:hypothetical protein P4O66_002678 [Electrophorus voltai]